jgi:hypothetical protein
MGCVSRGDAKTKRFLVAMAAVTAVGLSLSPATHAARMAQPTAVDFGPIKNGVAGGDCHSVFPPLPATAAMCSIIIHFDYARTAKGLSTGTLVIDGDTIFDTTADQTIVPLKEVSG